MSTEHEEIHFEWREPLSFINSSQTEEREMYIGSRRSCAQCVAMEDLYRGLI